MDLKTLMGASPESLAQTQFDALKLHTLEVLKKAIKHVEGDEYLKKDITFYSPAGDEAGIDSYPIDFGYDKNDALSFGEVADKLKHLHKLSQK